MKKYIIYSLLATLGLGLGSCTNEQELIFPESSAERLAAKQKEFQELLPKDGGLWAMEYFANSDEPGYILTMRFGADGSVTIGSTNKWTPGRTYMEDSSTWDITTDDGPVLSFNTWNSVLHLFSVPNNIPQGEGPKKPATGEDVDETGTGHGGDYEFRLRHFEDDGNTIVLSSKRQGFDIIMHRLPSDTDTKAYCDAQAQAQQNMFNLRFNRMAITDVATGERFILSDMTEDWMKGYQAGLYNIYPADGDSITQSVQTCGIITTDGLRFIGPVTVDRADVAAEPFVIKDKLFLQPDETFANADKSVTLTIGNLSQIVLDYAYEIDMTTATGKYAELFTTINDQVKAFNKKTLKDVSIRGKIKYVNPDEGGEIGTGGEAGSGSKPQGGATNKIVYEKYYKLIVELHFYQSRNKQYTASYQFDATPKVDDIELVEPKSAYEDKAEFLGFPINAGAKAYMDKVPAINDLCNFIITAPMHFAAKSPMDPENLDGNTGDATFKCKLK